MALAESHNSPKLEDRKAKWNPYGPKDEKYNKVEDVISLIVCDIANGVSHSDCVEKLQLGLYNNKPIKLRQSEFYYKAAMDRLRADRDTEIEKLKDVLYTRYESLFADSVTVGDRSTAKSILDSIAKIFLGTDQKNTNIQVNANKEGIKISFGFANETNDGE